MKKTTILILCLVFFSLACLSTAAAEPTLTNAATPSAISSPAGEVVFMVRDLATPGTDEPGQRCAIVTANSALHLRSAADLHAASVDHLLAGEEVMILDDSNADWWQVRRDDAVGFARSSFLRESECVENGE